MTQDKSFDEDFEELFNQTYIKKQRVKEAIDKNRQYIRICKNKEDFDKPNLSKDGDFIEVIYPKDILKELRLE